MKKSVVLVLLIVLAVLFVGCASVQPFAATSNPIGTKVGEAQVVYIFGCPQQDGADGGIAKAAANGGITSISTVDLRVKGSFFYKVVTTIVTGK